MSDKNIALSHDPEMKGLDVQSSKTWIYPTNYPTRDYQYNIIEKALLENTLVSLPTGLGKTFIAAVVMYNFYRWYPSGKIIFMAPTKPLVKQQVDACYDIMAIPKDTTAELTGVNVKASRTNIWTAKRVFFITPQVLQNDLFTIAALGTQIKCLVFDEAHKARGNHTYCEVIKKLSSVNKYFRVLALSATPGNNINDLNDIINNLHISLFEFRTEQSPDVSPYVFNRVLDIIVVPLDTKLEAVKNYFIQILEVHTRILVTHRLITGNCSSLTKGRIFFILQEYQEKNKLHRDKSYAEITRNLNICVTLYHGYDLLLKHGLRSFLTFFQEHAEKPLLQRNMELKAIMRDVEEYLGPPINVERLPDGSDSEVPRTSKFGHPKFYKIKDILLNHFSQSDPNSKVIIFCEYRESVREIYAILSQHKPLIRSNIFMGQTSITQRQQISIIKSFKSGDCNCLISTSIGEEGLDIGDVDLIICFDVSTKSPIRLIQRMGRTGRKKEGRVVIMVTKGKEEQVLKDCLAHKSNFSNFLLRSKNGYATALYKQSPRMLPETITPQCHKLFITVKAETKTKNSSLKDMFQIMAKGKNNESLSQQLSSVEIEETIDLLPRKRMLWNKENPMVDNSINKETLRFLGRESYRNLQTADKIAHSVNSEIFVSLQKLIDSKRYNLPITQTRITRLIGTENNAISYDDNLKQSDIRSMFAKQSSNTDFTSQTQELKSVECARTILDKPRFVELRDEITKYLRINSFREADCRFCSKDFSCSEWMGMVSDVAIPRWNPIDESIFDTIDANALTNYIEINCLSNDIENDVENDIFYDSFNENRNSIIWNESRISDKQKDVTIPERNNEMSCITDEENHTFNNSFNEKVDINILNESNISENEASTVKSQDLTISEENDFANDITIEYRHSLLFFKLDSLEDLFTTPSVKRTIVSENCIPSTHNSIKSPKSSSQSISFSPAESITNSYGHNSDIELSPSLCSVSLKKRTTPTKIGKNLNSSTPVCRTPPDKNDSKTHDSNVNTSPILFSPVLSKRRFMHSQVRKNSFVNENTLNSSAKSPNLSVLQKPIRNCFYTNQKRIDGINIPVSTPEHHAFDQKENIQALSRSDFCNVSMFGLCESSNLESSKQEIEISEVCDLSIFGFSQKGTHQEESKSKYESPEISRENLSVNKSTAIDNILSKYIEDGDSDETILLSPTTPIKKRMYLESEDLDETVLQQYDTPVSKSISKAPRKVHSFFNSPSTLKDLHATNLRERDVKTPKDKILMSQVRLKDDLREIFDDFDVSPFNKTFNTKLAQSLSTATFSEANESSNEFEHVSKTKRKKTESKRRATKKTKKSNHCTFIEQEAEMSSDAIVSADEAVADDDKFEESFVDDQTQDIADKTALHALYLQSVRSPIKHRGTYKIPAAKPMSNMEIFSQLNNTQDSYLNDSFCVSEEELQCTQRSNMDLSELEIAELILENSRKNKRKRLEEKESTTKRRRIIEISDSD